MCSLFRSTTRAKKHRSNHHKKVDVLCVCGLNGKTIGGLGDLHVYLFLRTSSAARNYATLDTAAAPNPPTNSLFNGPQKSVSALGRAAAAARGAGAMTRLLQSSLGPSEPERLHILGIILWQRSVTLTCEEDQTESLAFERTRQVRNVAIEHMAHAVRSEFSLSVYIQLPC